MDITLVQFLLSLALVLVRVVSTISVEHVTRFFTNLYIYYLWDMYKCAVKTV